ncbi:MAG: hypothetical protein JJ863_00595 [Deltaproteobacteria bacterium]|nr:hypothetical protein [Deltaproteobacteria bacterium]
MNCILKKHALAWALGGTLMGSLAGCAADTTVALEDELAAAREAEGLAELMPVELSDIDGEAEAIESGSLIHELELEGGRIIRFVEEEDGSVGVLEVGHAQQLMIPSFTRDEGVTSLELFQTLAPEADVPEALVAAHAREAEALERADLSVVPVRVPLGWHDEFGEQSYFRCDNRWSDPPNAYSHEWYFNNSWHQTFKNRTEVEESMVVELLDITNSSYFYAGGGPVRRVYLGVCVDDHWYGPFNGASDDVDFEVQRLVNGAWTHVVDYRLHGDDRAVYYNASWINRRYRGRIRAYDPPGGAYTDGLRDVGFAVAYDKPLQLQFELAP